MVYLSGLTASVLAADNECRLLHSLAAPLARSSVREFATICHTLEVVACQYTRTRRFTSPRQENI
jgi:hypothetical protein